MGEGVGLEQEWQYLPYWVHRGTVDSLYQYYIVPSTDAVTYPESYQIEGDLLKALQLFDQNTRKRLEDCTLKDGQNIEEHLFYRNTLPVHTKVGGVVPLRGNPLLNKMLQEKPKKSTKLKKQ